MHKVHVKIILSYIDLKVYNASVATEFVNRFFGMICGNIRELLYMSWNTEKGC